MAEVSEKFFPFDSEEHDGEYDREYVAEDFARYFRAFISSGTFMEEPTNLQVIANGDMSVTLKPGSMIIDGYRYDNVKEIKIQLDPADGVMSRIDRISVTWSKEDRDAHYTLRKGEISYKPVPKAARRTADHKDYVLADIYVKAGAIDITQQDITDQRLNSDVCGLAIPFAALDTSTLSAQLQAFYKHVVETHEEWDIQMQEKFESWFETVKNQLSGDVAGNLLNQIGTLSNLLTTSKSDIVSAINELYNRTPDMLETLEEIDANTESGKQVDAQAIKQLNRNLGGNILSYNESEDAYYIQYGADAAPKKLGSGTLKRIQLPNATIIDVKQYTNKWSELTDENFMVATSAVATARFSNAVMNDGVKATNTVYTSHSYNSETGILTITTGSNIVYAYGDATWRYTSISVTQAISAVYLYE